MLSEQDFLVFPARPVLVVGCVFCAVALLLSQRLRALAVFVWACFLKPFGSKSLDQQSSLETFYKSQAKVYDSTREILLQGRDQALQLAWCHMEKKTGNVWVDVGGGTGRNIEKMSEIVDLAEAFEAVYLVDLSPLLCEVARSRVKAHNWSNVHVVCADACLFSCPVGQADLVTFLYLLLMIPAYHSAVDHVSRLIRPESGLICVVDFGVQAASNSIGRANTVGGCLDRHVPWAVRTFWRLWFECDRVYLDPSRREYLEHVFGTVKALNCYNRRLGKIPYYIWLGCHKYLHENVVLRHPNKEAPAVPYSSMHYQSHSWRQDYDELKLLAQDRFANQYIYAFTWEDPKEDEKILRISSKDKVLAITSAGDNILSYAALSDAPQEIHGVDLNPCQGHLAELKMASIRALEYLEVWRMFGEGKIDNFKHILITKLAPHMSSNAFQYWMNHSKTFSGKGFYDTGSTRWALRLVQYVFGVTGLKHRVEQLCKAKTVNEQKEIWNTHIRPVLLSKVVARFLVGNKVFLWKALGVPENQAHMMDTSILQYVVDTFDPVIGRSLISRDNYFYYLCLMGRYTPRNCPDYLTKSGFQALSTGKSLETIHLHTDYLSNVLGSLKGLTIAVIMDHMDWFDPEALDVDEEIKCLWSALDSHGRVMLRLAAKKPWYISNFEHQGFICRAVATRHSGTSIDRVNMYASTWICKKGA